MLPKDLCPETFCNSRSRNQGMDNLKLSLRAPGSNNYPLRCSGVALDLTYCAQGLLLRQDNSVVCLKLNLFLKCAFAQLIHEALL